MSSGSSRATSPSKSSGASTPTISPLKKAFSSFSRASGRKAMASSPAPSEPSPPGPTTDSDAKRSGDVEEAVGPPLTASQEETLSKLTALLTEDGAIPTPLPSWQRTQVLRFLRARQWDDPAARTMFLKAEAWKKSISLDTLVDTFEFSESSEVSAAGWRMYFHGTDTLGRPVLIQDLSYINTTALFNATTPDRIIRNFAVTLELAVRHRYPACTQASRRWVDDNLMIVNVAGLGLTTFWAMKGQLQQLLATLDNNFPELSGRVQIINAPYMFSTAWSWIKGWLPAGTVEKIDIAGYEYLDNVLAYVDRNDWPKALGGECRCEEHGGCEKSDIGPWRREDVKPSNA